MDAYASADICSFDLSIYPSPIANGFLRINLRTTFLFFFWFIAAGEMKVRSFALALMLLIGGLPIKDGVIK